MRAAQFFPVLLLIGLISCHIAGEGESTFLSEKLNKEKTKKAILFLRESGATVPNSYQVSVIDAAYRLSKNETGNTFTVDDDHGNTILDSNSIKFRWLANDTLQIYFDKKLRTFIKKSTKNEVKIIYKNDFKK